MHPVKTVFLLASAAMAVITLVSVGVDARSHNGNIQPPILDSTVAPLLVAEDADIIEGHYIVVLKKDLSEQQLENHHNMLATFLARYGGLVDEGGQNQIRHVYEMDNLRGYAGKFTDMVIEKVRVASEVDFVERDSTVYATKVQTQYNAPWGLSRISHRETLTFRTWTKYPYDSIDGKGITAYIVDTGINIHHVDFEGRAIWGATIPEGDEDEDGNGHGTHVAGTIGGKTYGVAKKANLVAVKVLRSNGSGSMSDVVSGVQWVAEAHTLAVKEAQKIPGSSKSKASVANMSLGGGFSRALNMAVDAAVDVGVHFAVAAGNDNRDACQYSPASAEKAITVGATTLTDERAWFSNYGKCTDVFAPGHNIKSTWIGSKTATNTISGTSMASPHVCGLMAYLLSLEEDPSTVTPKQLKDKIIKLSTRNTISDMPKETKNRLIYSGVDDEINNDDWFGWIKTVVDKFTITL